MKKNQVNESKNKEVNFLGMDVLSFILTVVEADSYQMTRDLIQFFTWYTKEVIDLMLMFVRLFTPQNVWTLFIYFYISKTRKAEDGGPRWLQKTDV